MSRFLQRIFQALLHLDSFSRFKQDIPVCNIDLGNVKSLMATTFVIEDVLADDFPVFDIEGFLTENAIRIGQSV
jgi:hypothetical protein